MTDTDTLPCGIAAPQIFPDGCVDTALIRSYAARAEELGYHSLWVQEQIVGASVSLEPVALLSYLAGVTDTIGLGAAVLILTTRNPVHLAKQVASLDRMSGGRLILGAALGGQPGLYDLLDGPPDRRVRHFTEALDVMRALWTQDRVDFEGGFWKLEGASMAPKPARKPHPPIWFGGRHPDALRRAARLADGWIGAGSTTTQQFREHVGIIRAALDDENRDPAGFPISKRVYVALDDDEARAEDRLTEWFGHHYGRPAMASKVSIWGGLDRCVEGLAEVVNAGAQMLMLNPVFDHLEHLEALRQDVMPRLPAPCRAGPS